MDLLRLMKAVLPGKRVKPWGSAVVRVPEQVSQGVLCGLANPFQHLFHVHYKGINVKSLQGAGLKARHGRLAFSSHSDRLDMYAAQASL
jgi:hypothetical protein